MGIAAGTLFVATVFFSGYMLGNHGVNFRIPWWSNFIPRSRGHQG